MHQRGLVQHRHMIEEACGQEDKRCAASSHRLTNQTMICNGLALLLAQSTWRIIVQNCLQLRAVKGAAVTQQQMVVSQAFKTDDL